MYDHHRSKEIVYDRFSIVVRDYAELAIRSRVRAPAKVVCVQCRAAQYVPTMCQWSRGGAAGACGAAALLRLGAVPAIVAISIAGGQS